jgi:hypothetical protein
MQTFQVQCPAGVSPGQTFQANVGGRVVAVRVPPNGSAGMLMNIQVPAAAPVAQAPQPGQAQIRIPPGVMPGQQIRANVGGRTIQVTVPQGYSQGMLLTVQVPAAAPTPYSAPAPQHRPPPRPVAQPRPAPVRPAAAPKPPKPTPASRASPPRQSAGQSSLLDAALGSSAKKKPQAVAHPTPQQPNNGEISALWFLNMGI